MKTKFFLAPLFFFILLIAGRIGFTAIQTKTEEQIISYIADAKSQDIQFFWKNDKGEILKSIQNLKTYVESKKANLIFATNGGMYKKDFSPQGLFIQREKTLSELDISTGNGNFYLKPNGVFYITIDNIPIICKTEEFKDKGQIKYATQSGPMLVIDGLIHPAFKEGSKSVYVRNGVGILPGNKLLFAMSEKEINFYDFASYFKKMGCLNALYLDGFVSRTYLPEKNWMQTDGNFGVMIGITTPIQK